MTQGRLRPKRRATGTAADQTGVRGIIVLWKVLEQGEELVGCRGHRSKLVLLTKGGELSDEKRPG